VKAESRTTCIETRARSVRRPQHREHEHAITNTGPIGTAPGRWTPNRSDEFGPKQGRQEAAGKDRHQEAKKNVQRREFGGDATIRPASRPSGQDLRRLVVKVDRERQWDQGDRADVMIGSNKECRPISTELRVRAPRDERVISGFTDSDYGAMAALTPKGTSSCGYTPHQEPRHRHHRVDHKAREKRQRPPERSETIAGSSTSIANRAGEHQRFPIVGGGRRR